MIATPNITSIQPLFAALLTSHVKHAAQQYDAAQMTSDAITKEVLEHGSIIYEAAANQLRQAMASAGLFDVGGTPAAPAAAPAHACMDHAANLRAAIEQSRLVFESEPVGAQLLDYLQQVLNADSSATAAWLRGDAEAGAPAAPEVRKTDIVKGIAYARFMFANLSDAQLAIDYMELVLDCAGVKLPADLAQRDDAPAAPSTVDGSVDTEPTSTLKLSIDARAIAAALAQVEQLEREVAKAGAALGRLLVARFEQSSNDIGRFLAQLEADAAARKPAQEQAVAPLTAQQVDKIENHLMTGLLTVEQRESARAGLVAEFRALNAMGVQPAEQGADTLGLMMDELRCSRADKSVSELPTGQQLSSPDLSRLRPCDCQKN